MKKQNSTMSNPLNRRSFVRGGLVAGGAPERRYELVYALSEHDKP